MIPEESNLLEQQESYMNIKLHEGSDGENDENTAGFVYYHRETREVRGRAAAVEPQ